MVRSKKHIKVKNGGVMRDKMKIDNTTYHENETRRSAFVVISHFSH
jgi:hypothetical protein